MAQCTLGIFLSAEKQQWEKCIVKILFEHHFTCTNNTPRSPTALKDPSPLHHVTRLNLQLLSQYQFRAFTDYSTVDSTLTILSNIDDNTIIAMQHTQRYNTIYCWAGARFLWMGGSSDLISSRSRFEISLKSFIDIKNNVWSDSSIFQLCKPLLLVISIADTVPQWFRKHFRLFTRVFFSKLQFS